MSTYRPPRLSIEISDEDKAKLSALLPHGMQKIVFNLIVRDLINLMEKHGAMKVIDALTCRHISIDGRMRFQNGECKRSKN
jgi:hypothetical protein